jgi:hypothetical protein
MNLSFVVVKFKSIGCRSGLSRYLFGVFVFESLAHDVVFLFDSNLNMGLSST